MLQLCLLQTLSIFKHLKNNPVAINLQETPMVSRNIHYMQIRYSHVISHKTIGSFKFIINVTIVENKRMLSI